MNGVSDLILRVFVANGNQPLGRHELLKAVYPLRSEIQMLAFRVGVDELVRRGGLVIVFLPSGRALYWVAPQVYESAKEVAWEWFRAGRDD